MTWAAAASLTGWRLMGDKWETLSRWNIGGKSNILQDLTIMQVLSPSGGFTRTAVTPALTIHSTRLCYKNSAVYTGKVICFHTHTQRRCAQVNVKRVKAKQLHSDENKHWLEPLTCSPSGFWLPAYSSDSLRAQLELRQLAATTCPMSVIDLLTLAGSRERF